MRPEDSPVAALVLAPSWKGVELSPGPCPTFGFFGVTEALPQEAHCLRFVRYGATLRK